MGEGGLVATAAAMAASSRPPAIRCIKFIISNVLVAVAIAKGVFFELSFEGEGTVCHDCLTRH